MKQDLVSSWKDAPPVLRSLPSAEACFGGQGAAMEGGLDESNINQFIRVLQRFLAHSQFIVIKHNKPVPRQRELAARERKERKERKGRRRFLLCSLRSFAAKSLLRTAT